MLVRRIEWDGPAYRIEWAVFYTLGRCVHFTVDVAVYGGSVLDRLLGRRAR